MKNYVLTLIGTLMLGNSIAVAQDYDDVYYDTGSSKQKSEKSVKVKTADTNVAGRNPYFTQKSRPTTTPVDTAAQVINGRDVDEYNRRYADDAQQYYADEAASYEVADSTSGSDFTYTDRIVKFHNADVVVRSNDPDLIELYYDNRPQVNIVVGTTLGGWYGDPFYWGVYDPWYSWNWYRPYRYGWYAGWYDPWYSWGWGWGIHSAWHYGWYDPCWSWGWGHPHYAWHGHGWGGGWNHGWARPYTDGGRLTAGHRGSVGRLPVKGASSYASGRPGYASSVRRGGVTEGNLSTVRGSRVVSGRASAITRDGSRGYASSRPGTSVSSRPGTTGSIRSSVGSQAGSRSSSVGTSSRRSSVGTSSRSSSYSRSYDVERSSSRSTSSYNSGSRSSGFSSGYSGGGMSSGGSRGGGMSGGGSRGGRR